MRFLQHYHITLSMKGVVIITSLLMALLLSILNGCSVPQEREPRELTVSQKYDMLNTEISKAYSLSKEERMAASGGCDLVSAVAAIAAAGFDVIPREDKYNVAVRWPRAFMVGDSISCAPDTTRPVMYYIAEYRFAVVDTQALVRIDNMMAPGSVGFGFRVASVGYDMDKMSKFTNPVYTDTLFYGIDFDTPEWSCGGQ